MRTFYGLNLACAAVVVCGACGTGDDAGPTADGTSESAPSLAAPETTGEPSSVDTLEEPSEGPAEDPDSLSLAAPLSIVIDGRTFEGTAQLQIVEIPGAFSAILSAQGAVGDDIVRFGQALGATALRRFGKGENVILPGDSVLMYGAHDSDYGVLRSIRAIVVDERLQLDVTFEYSAPIAGASAGALVATGQLDIMCMVRAPGGDDGTMLVDAALQTDVCRRTVRGHGLAHLIPHQVVEAP